MPKISLSDEVINTLVSKSKQEDFYDLNFRLKGSFGVRLGHGGKKTFFVIYSKADKRVRVSLGHFPSVSYRKAIKLAEDTIQDSNIEHHSSARSSPPLSEVSSLFLKKSRLNGLSDKTLKEYGRILEKEILPKLGSLEVRKIKLGDLQKILVDIAYERRKVPLSNRVRSLLTRLINFSIEMGYRVRNPLYSTRPLIETKSVKNLDLNEIRTLYSHLRKESSVLANAVLLSILLVKDLRAILNLRWSDLRGFTILFREQNNTFEVPLTETMLHIIELQRKAGKHDNIYIFTSKRGGIIKYFEKTLHKMGLKSAVSPRLSSSLINKSLLRIMESLLLNLNTEPEFRSTFKAINQNTSINPKSQNSFLLKWEDILKGNENNFLRTRNTKATGQLIMVPQSWWQKT